VVSRQQVAAYMNPLIYPSIKVDAYFIKISSTSSDSHICPLGVLDIDLVA
jgi:hypothetical protein